MIVTRFAPSPTGKFHIGGVRSALFNYLYARQHNGKFILRSEDTDEARSKKEYEDYFLEVFSWLGITYDEFYRQSERLPIYRKYLEKLIAENKAYLSKETPKEEGQRSEVIRFRNPGTKVTFLDQVLGEISFDTKELGDFVIARDVNSPLYHFAVVVDDFEMGVTHIIRGQEHVSNTPRHILIQEALKAPRPIYAHVSIILNHERAKLSKRDSRVMPALEYRDAGYLPEAITNFVALLGWNPGTEKELFTRDELITSFSIDRLQKPGAIFNPEKLLWFNREYISQLSPDTFASYAKKFLLPETLAVLNEKGLFEALIPIMRERIQTFGELTAMDREGEFSYFIHAPAYDSKKITWKGETPAATGARLGHVHDILKNLPKEDNAWTSEAIKNALFPYATAEGRGQVLWPLRYALSGREKSPDPFTIAGIIGRDETLSRITHAISKLDTE